MDFKKCVIGSYYFDIVIIPETHCLPGQNIEIDNYKIFQTNRPPLHNSTHGSGGIAIAVNHSLLKYHEVISILNYNVDGQLAITLKNKINGFTLGVIGCYLSPNSFHYGRDPEGFFNNAAALWQDLIDCDLRVGGGDLNARTKQLLDFIPEIDGDMVPPRQNPDNNKNSHGDCFISFLKENQSVILNGRITPNLNNYTFVSTRGCSVPDYIFCDIENLSMCSEMKTMLISDIINENNSYIT